MSEQTLKRTAAVAGTAVAVVFFIAVMTDSDYRRTGTNSLVVPAHAVVGPGQRLCQGNELIPARSGHVAPWVGGREGSPGGPATVTIETAGGVVARGRSPERYPTGITRFRLDRTVPEEIFPATVCFTNRASEPLLMYGIPAPSGAPPVETPDGSGTVVRLDWFGAERQSWFGFVGSIAERFPRMKAGFLGEWAFWLVIGAALGLGGAAVARVLREARA